MRHTLRTLAAGSLALVLSASAALAAPAPFKIDTSHSLVGFKIRHFTKQTKVYSNKKQNNKKNK